jgi:hypothetical protein
LTERETEEQHLFSKLVASEADFRGHLSAHPWWEVANMLASAINKATELGNNRALPIAEIKTLWLAYLKAPKIVTDLREQWRSDAVEVGRLHSAWSIIAQTLRARGVHSQAAITRAIIERSDWHHLEDLR